MHYGQQRYAKRLREEVDDESARNKMVQRRLSDGAKRHLPIIRQGNLKSPSHDEYMSSIPSNENLNNRNDIFITSKKDHARKNLMGYLYSRQPTINRSNSFIVGEKPAEPGLPSVKYKNTPKNFERQRTILFEQRIPLSYTNDNQPPSRRRSAGSNRPGSNKFSLPEIMRDIYSSAAKLDNHEEEFDEEFPSSDGNSMTENITPLNFSKKPVKIYPPNHRPITPGLIEKLNKMKVSSRHRTEQWVKEIPDDPKKTQEYRRKGRHYDPPSRWIYTDHT